LRLRAYAWLGLITSALYVILVLANPLSRIVDLVDDGLFFVRYAHNFHFAGKFAWNLSEPPSFGATSQLYQLTVTCVQFFCPKGEPFSVVIAALLGGVMTCVFLILALQREMAVAERFWRGRGIEFSLTQKMTAWVCFFGVALIAVNPLFYTHWHTGLETTCSTALVALFVLLLPTLVKISGGILVGLPVAAIMLFWQRPDMGLIGVMPFLVGLFMTQGKKRLEFLYGGMITACLLTLTLVVWKAYYGVILPLPSIVKTGLSAYNHTNVDRLYAYGNRVEFRSFLHKNEIAVLGLIAFFSLWKKLTGTAVSIADKALGLSALAYALFQTFGNKYPVTSSYARFFMPLFPIVVCFGFRGLSLLMLWWVEREPAEPARAARTLSVLGAIAVALVPLTEAPVFYKDTVRPVMYSETTKLPANVHDALVAQMLGEDKWTMLLPELNQSQYDHCSIADSEIGGISLLPASRIVLDMSGLNNIDLTLRHENPIHYLQRKAPDYIYYKYVDFYWGLALENDPWVRNNYQVYPTLGIAARNGSGCTIEVPSDGRMHLGAANNLVVQ
jgi:hypothetical protein